MDPRSACPKCGEPRRDERPACPRCGLLQKNWGRYVATPIKPSDALFAAWTALREKWSDEVAHKKFLDLAANLLELDAAAALYRQHYAHEKESEDGRPLHVVHCDVSPGNVIVTYEGGIKLVDFGIATAQLRAAAKGSGQVQGKIGYMSPEQARGERCDRRTDVYAAGVMLYELSLGRRLYKGNNDFHILNRLMAGDFARPCEVDPTYDPVLEAIVLRALSSERVERFPSALAMQQELEVYARQRGVFMSSSSLKNFMGELFAKKIADARRMRRFTDGVPIPRGDDTTAPDMPSPVAELNAPAAMLTPDPSGEVMTLPPSVAAELDVHPSGRSSRLWRGGVAVGVAALLALVAIAVRTPTSVPATAASGSTLAPLIAAAATAGSVASPSRAVAAIGAGSARPSAAAAEHHDSDVTNAKTTAPSRRASSGSSRSHHEPKRATSGNARFGALTLTSNPGCEVVVDGKPRGQTPLTLSLPPGSHKISISNRKLSIKRQLSVAIKPGEVVTKALDFSEYL